ncbi:STAS domain-containing protein [Nocardia thailandica]|uniref:Anti-sigma factor antagonist n=1 Tax=Nocardia thailandica TaxID=257275 RepID=A0ABW6PXB7_9NOCA
MRFGNSAQPFSIEQRSAGRGAVVTVAGEVDIHTAPRLADALGEVIEEASPHPLVVDLTGVEFLDSSGVNVLLRTHRRVGDLRVVASPAVRRPLEVTGLTATMNIFDDLEAALSPLPRSPGGPDDE